MDYTVSQSHLTRIRMNVRRAADVLPAVSVKSCGVNNVVGSNLNMVTCSDTN